MSKRGLRQAGSAVSAVRFHLSLTRGPVPSLHIGACTDADGEKRQIAMLGAWRAGSLATEPSPDLVNATHDHINGLPCGGHVAGSWLVGGKTSNSELSL